MPIQERYLSQPSVQHRKKTSALIKYFWTEITIGLGGQSRLFNPDSLFDDRLLNDPQKYQFLIRSAREIMKCGVRYFPETANTGTYTKRKSVIALESIMGKLITCLEAKDQRRFEQAIAGLPTDLSYKEFLQQLKPFEPRSNLQIRRQYEDILRKHIRNLSQ